MIKIRVIRESVDETVNPTIRTKVYPWIGYIVSGLTDDFPVGDGSETDPLADCGFEGFANGTWLEISDPRTNKIPTSERELLNSSRGRCKSRHAVDNGL